VTILINIKFRLDELVSASHSTLKTSVILKQVQDDV